MDAPTITTTYRAPDGQILHNVIFNPDTGYYKWKDDQGKACILKAERFEQMMTPILDPADQPDQPGLVKFARFGSAPLLIVDEVNSLPSKELPAVTDFLADPVTANDGDIDIDIDLP